MSETLYAFIFYFLSALIIGSSVMVVLARNMVYSAVALFMTMVGISGVFMMLDAEFLASVQILIYAGAATILLLFVVMITSKKIEKPAIWFNAQADVSLLVVGIITTGIILAIVRSQWEIVAKTVEKTTAQLALALFRSYGMPFEVASVLLLVALVGAIVLARRENND